MSADRHCTFGNAASGIRRATPMTSSTSSSCARASRTLVPALPLAPMTTTRMSWRYPTPRPGNLRLVIRLALALLALTATAAVAAPTPSVTVTGRALSGVEGTEVNTTVASGTTTSKSTICLRATIDWGDGASSPGTIPAGGSNFTVRGRHTYQQAGAPDLVTTVRDVCNNVSGSAHSPVTIGDAPLTATGVPVKAYARYPATVVVATFTDGNPFAKASDFTATVDW